MKVIISLIILTQVTAALAFGTSSLTWQKLALEEKVQRKFNTTLSNLLKDNQYLVEVETEITEPPGPDFGANDKKTGPRVSDLNLEESRGDYIAFSKMGLEVPVVDKFLDEDRTKLMNLYRFNESYDLFKNISGLNVTVFLSDKIPADYAAIVKKVLQSSKLTVSGIKPVIKFEDIAMEWIDPKIAEAEKLKANQKEKKKVPEEPRIWLKDWLEWASRWGNAFGLILGSVIIGFIALTLFKQWRAFMEKFVPKEAPKEEEDPKDAENQVTNVDQPLIEELSTQEEEVAISQGFERFQQCLEQHPDEAVTIVRKWLNEGDANDSLALRYVAQHGTPEQMDKLMSGLSEMQRDKWKAQLGKDLEIAEVKEATKHIFHEVVKAFLVPSKVKDGELLNLIMELSSKTACDFFKEHDDHVGILMNLLSPSLINKILLEVDEDTAATWLEAASEFQMKTMDEKLPELKEALSAFKESSFPSPFAHRIMTMIPAAKPANEGTLFRALAKSGNSDMVLEVARKAFPSELVMELPVPFLKEVIQSYPMAKRIEFLYSRTPESRSNILNMLAEAGTPARDMMDMELENLERDNGRKSDITNRSEDIWMEFVKVCRTSLVKNPAYTSSADQLLKDWAQKLNGGLRAINGGRAA